MLTKESIIKELESHKKQLKELGVKRVALFGSYAQGSFTEDSDIDFLVEFRKGRGLFKDYSNLTNFLEDMFQKKIDIVKPHLVRKELRSSILEGERIEAEI